MILFICPVCDGVGAPLGTLGNIEWIRCESCGIEWSITIQSAEEEEEEE